MKKVFLFLFAAVMLASCSNKLEDDVTPEQLYKVTFKVSNFEATSKPLKSEAFGNQCHYAIYKKDNGALVKNKLMAELGQISEELPAGDYYIAILSAPMMDILKPVFTPFNYNTDYCVGNSYITKGKDNRNIYYGKLDFIVAANLSEDPVDVDLKPTWSVMNIKVTDADECILPEGTNLVQCHVNPHYYGFKISDGIPTESYTDFATLVGVPFIDLAQFRTEKGYQSIIVAASEDVTVKLIFIRHTESEACTVLSEKFIYKGDIKGGVDFTLTGKLGDATSTAMFNLSLLDLEDGGEIPF